MYQITKPDQFEYIEFSRLFQIVFKLNENLINVNLQILPELNFDFVLKSKSDEISICGKSRSDLFCGIYYFYEKCGMCFEFSSEFFSKPNKLELIPDLYEKIKSSISKRGIRMHLNFVQDQSFFSEKDFLSFIENISKMKMNYLVFHMYNNQEL